MFSVEKRVLYEKSKISQFFSENDILFVAAEKAVSSSSFLTTKDFVVDLNVEFGCTCNLFVKIHCEFGKWNILIGLLYS